MIDVWDVIIIGGGAAGLWAAGTASARGLKVLVLEKNVKAGVKILMSGGSRCNITHHCDITGIMEAFGNQGRFLKPALHNLGPADVVAEVNRWGVATKVEETGKVFPVSDRALDVRDALVRRLTDGGARLQTGVAVQRFERQSTGQWRVFTEGEEFVARALILATGGLSYAGCGTTGDGYPWAAALGHKIEPTHAALTPLLSPAVWVHELQGLTLEDVRVTAVYGSEKPQRDPRHTSRTSLLWTHFGFSGPAAMNVSGAVSGWEEPHRARLLVDLVPELSESACATLLDAQGGSGKRSLHSVLSQHVPRRMAECLSVQCEVAGDVTLAELPKRARLKLVESLKKLSVPLAGTRGYPKAEVTAGGVCRQEVNPHTLESRLSPGLFFAGEILDVDGPIGGFNFQAAFATGHTAATHV
ncbi:MAG: aminoacetone oxidase family FAD-binding enzyme [Pirellulaceae bacterium]|nr:aminoacetone oxidase family FAD-binding enzyme [Pirellulaceae bacterium]